MTVPVPGRKLTYVWLLVVAAASAGAELLAGDLLNCHKRCEPCESTVCARPDSYCAKLLPCLKCRCGVCRCDDYCRKPLPCLPCRPLAFRCDNYCGKPSPPLCSYRLMFGWCRSGAAGCDQSACGTGCIAAASAVSQ